jgi:hypothetical protein
MSSSLYINIVYILVVQYYIWQPNVLRRYMQMSNTAILGWIPFQLVVEPFLELINKVSYHIPRKIISGNACTYLFKPHVCDQYLSLHVDSNDL